MYICCLRHLFIYLFLWTYIYTCNYLYTWWWWIQTSQPVLQSRVWTIRMKPPSYLFHHIDQRRDDPNANLNLLEKPTSQQWLELHTKENHERMKLPKGITSEKVALDVVDNPHLSWHSRRERQKLLPIWADDIIYSSRRQRHAAVEATTAMAPPPPPLRAPNWRGDDSNWTKKPGWWRT